MSKESLEKYNVTPIAKVIAFADHAVLPIEFAIAPVGAMEKLLKMSNLKKDDISSWEINEAFSVVVLSIAKLMDLDLNKVNINGGAVSLGHPIGNRKILYRFIK